jgi:hypothetical protein
MLCFLFGFVLTTVGWAALAYCAFRRLCLRLKDNPHAVQALTALLRLALLGKEPAGDAAPPAKPEAKPEAKKIKGTLV